MRYLVTGGAGFIGSHLVDALVSAGHEVTVIDWNDPVSDRKNTGATYINMDVRSPEIVQTVARIAPHTVFHLAAHIDDRASVQDPVMNAEHNVLGSLNIFEAAKRAGAKKIVFASSCAVYGTQEKFPISEKMTARPRTPYGISKLAGEKYLDAYTTVHGMTTVALRFANVYGPRQDGSKESGAIAIFTDKILRNESPFLNGDGSTTRDYIFVGDIVSALLAASDGEISGVFNVGTGKEVTTRDVFARIQQVIGASSGATPRPDVHDAVVRMVLSASLMKKTFGWKPRVSLRRGIAQTVAWYKKRLSV